MKKIAVILLLLVSTHASAISFSGKIPVVSNDLDWVYSQVLEKKLARFGLEIIRADSLSADSRFNLVFGGQNSPGVSGPVSTRLLDEKQKKSLTNVGSQRMFQFGDTFILAGYEKQDTGAAIKNQGDYVVGIITERIMENLSVEMSENILIEPIKNLMSYSFPIKVVNNGGY